MFLYVRNLKTMEQAQKAIAKGAVALAVSLSANRNMEAENTRTWLEEITMHILKIGEFDSELYYDIEELVTFCHLDIVLLRDLKTVKDFHHYTGRVMIEITEWELQDMKRFDEEAYKLFMETADGIRLRVTDYTNLDNPLFWQYLRDLQKPIFLTADFESGSIEQAMAVCEEQKIPNLVALFVDYEDLV